MSRRTKAWKRLSLAERKAISEHHRVVRELGCIVTGSHDYVTIHHCHSGSISDAGITRGVGQRPSDWLVIPISFELHVGNQGLDSGIGIRTWEAEHGKQIHHLQEVGRRLGYCVFEKAGYLITAEGLQECRRQI